MAVRLLKKARLPTKIASSVENNNEITKTTLDHVRRILTDHDYLKHPTLDGENNEKTSVVMKEVKEPHVGLMTVQSDMQDQSEACLFDISKVNKSEVATNEGGIEASDLAGLLDKFEEAIGNSSSILTPATSPGRCENWSEPLSLKINSHEDATDLTPPSTPPIQEQPDQRCIHNNCKHLTRKASSKLEVKKNTLIKEKDEKVKCTAEQKMPNTVVSKKVGIAEHSKARGKRKCNDTTPGAILEKKAKILVENKKVMDVKFSDESSGNMVVNFDENSTNKESLISIKNDSVVGDVIKEKSSKVSKDENIAVAKDSASEQSLKGENCEGMSDAEKLPTINSITDSKTEQKNNDNVKESSNDENCSKPHDLTQETLPKLDEKRKQNEVHNNNNNEIELKVNTCKNNDIRQVENSQKKKHLNDSHRDDDRKSKNRGKDETSKRRSERVKEVSRDDKRRRKHRSRSPSTEEDSNSSDEERTDPRKSERCHESERHSHDSKRRKEKRRKHSSRDEYDEERRHRRYDDHYQRKPWKYVRDVERERKIDFRLGRSSIRDVAKGERRVIYVGGLPYGTTRDELWNRFRKFGPIEKITVHLRVGERDNYGFVTFLEPEDARACIEQGNSDPTEPQFDLCFGGRRQFCGGSYVDFDSTTSHIEELSETYGKVCDDIPEENDFDSLLRMCQEGLGR